MIPSSSVIDLAKTLAFGLGGTTDYDIVFEDFLQIGIQEFHAPSIMVKRQMTLDIECGRAKLPCDFNEMIMLVPHCGSIYSQYIYVNLPIFKKMGCEGSLTNTCFPFQNSYQIEQNYLYLHNSSQVDDDDEDSEPTQLDIYYWALNTDEDGLMYIYRDYKTCLAYYIVHLFKLMQNDYKGGEFWLQRYKTKRRYIRAKDRSDEFEKDKSEIMATMNAFVVAKTNYKFTAN